MLEMAKAQIAARIQRRETTSRQPAARSAKKCCSLGLASVGAGRSARRDSALTTKVAASISRMNPVPTARISSPASAGPKIPVALRERLIRALACCRRPALTVCGSSPLAAGRKKALAPPITAAPTARCQTWALWVISSTASTTSPTHRTRSQTTMTSCRGSRSATTPPASTRATCATLNEAKTMPRSVAVPIPSTAKAIATGISASPASDVVWPIQSSRNCGSLSAPKGLARCVMRASPPTPRG